MKIYGSFCQAAKKSDRNNEVAVRRGSTVTTWECFNSFFIKFGLNVLKHINFFRKRSYLIYTFYSLSKGLQYRSFRQAFNKIWNDNLFILGHFIHTVLL